MRNTAAIALLLLVASTAAAADLPKPQKIVIVFEENKSYEDVVKSGNAPYITSLAAAGASINIAAFHHPSQPNYIEFFYGTNTLTLASGSYTVIDDSCFAAPATSATVSILNQLQSNFRGYAEGWSAGTPVSTCTIPPPIYFARKHCPWLVAANGLNYAGSFKDFAATPFAKLPPLSMVIPNLIHDMHSLPGIQRFNIEGSGHQIPELVENGDDWLKNNLSAYAQWAMNNNSLLIITWDENSRGSQEGHDNGKGFRPPDNHIPTIFYGPMVIPGSNGGSTIYTHYDLQLTVMRLLGLNGVGGGAKANEIAGIWK